MLFSQQTVVQLKKDAILHAGTLSADIVALLETTVQKYLCQARQLGATQFAAIATEVFRTATNGEAVLRKLQETLLLPTVVVDQQLEGRLGFLTAQAVGGCPADCQVLAWDSGAASFQITPGAHGEQAVYMARLGSATQTAAMIEHILQRPVCASATTNPCTQVHADAMVAWTITALPVPPPWLTNLVRAGSPVVAIGGPTSIFNVATILLGRTAPTEITAGDIALAIEQAVGHNDQDLVTRWTQALSEPEMVVPKLALMLAVMRKFDMASVRYCPSNGSCPGVLTYEPLWSRTSRVI